MSLMFLTQLNSSIRVHVCAPKIKTQITQLSHILFLTSFNVTSIKSLQSCVELLLVRLHVDVTLKLSAGSAQLKAQSASLSALVKFSKAAHTAVLHGVLEASSQVGDELVDGATVSDGTGDTLSNKDAVTLRKVTGSSGVALLAVLATTASLLVLHGVNAAHATVGLDQLTLAGDKRGTGRLGGTSQQATHHDGGGAKGKTLDDVANVLYTTIGNARNTKLGSEVADTVHSSGLRTADSHDFLGDTSGTATHTNTQAVDTSGNQRGSLLAGDNVTTNDVEVRELSFAPLDHLDLVHAVTLRAVKDDNVEASVNKLLETGFIFGSGTNSSGAKKLLAGRQLRGEGEVLVLGQIGAGDHGDQVGVLVNNGQLALSGLGQDLVGFGQGDTVGSGDEVGDHDFRHGYGGIVFELEVTVGDNTEKLGTELSVLYFNLSVFVF